MLKKYTKKQKQEQSDQLYSDLIQLQHHICCDVETFIEVGFDSPTMRKRLEKQIHEWNTVGYDLTRLIS